MLSFLPKGTPKWIKTLSKYASPQKMNPNVNSRLGRVLSVDHTSVDQITRHASPPPVDES